MKRAPVLNLESWLTPDRAPVFWDKVLFTEDCWLWTGQVSNAGYGRWGIWSKERTYNVCAHRYAYEFCIGPIPEGLIIDHLCRNRACVHPDHLEAVTNRDNTLRGQTLPAINAQKTHCIHGHVFDEANTYYVLKNNARQCRACVRIRTRDGYRRKQQ